MKTTTIASLALAGLALPVSATTLTFDIDGITNGVLLSQDYGDRVTSETDGSFSYLLDGGATPNVEVSYARAGGGDLSWWNEDYNDLQGVVYNEADGAAGYSIMLTADAGWLVDLRGFDLGNFGPEVTVGVSIEDGFGGVLDATAAQVLPSTGNPHVSYNPASPAVAQTVVINISTVGLGGFSDNVGIDNITFRQVPIPAPGSVALSGVAGVVLLRRRR